jgi:hypothetical protein
MPLTMRPTGLEPPVDKNREDSTIYSGEWAMGRIYQQRGGPESMRWFWSLYGVFGKPADMRTSQAPTPEAAKIEFETAWHRWLAWARLNER